MGLQDMWGDQNKWKFISYISHKESLSWQDFMMLEHRGGEGGRGLMEELKQ